MSRRVQGEFHRHARALGEVKHDNSSETIGARGPRSNRRGVGFVNAKGAQRAARIQSGGTWLRAALQISVAFNDVVFSSRLVPGGHRLLNSSKEGF